MKYNFKQALTYMFEDKKRISKFAIAYLVVCIPLVMNILSSVFKSFVKNANPLGYIEPRVALIFAVLLMLGLIVSLLCNFLYLGYYFSNANLRIMLPDEKLLGWHNKKKLFSVGFKGFIGSCVYMLPIALLSVLAVKIKSIALFLILFFLAIFVIYAVTLAFITDLKFSSFFNFKKYKLILVDNFVNYLKFILISIGITIPYIIAVVLCAITIVGVVFLPFLYFYIQMVFNDIQAQFIRHILNMNKEGSEG
ncbi:MAG: DUF4013 domain-containing protein [Candidatus Gastranaerophilales bacterium]|nr:DUF4013 domain-containing protein [Candidatus Gastranaerophilales bacterium]